jgi:FMNH2-dependent dimethyl sulfone monooxygenase
LVGTPERVAEQVAAFEQAGVDLLLLQFSPQLEEMEKFAASVIRRPAKDSLHASGKR